MAQSDNRGCLGSVLAIFGIVRQEESVSAAEQDLPYRLRDDFLSSAELAYFRVLSSAVGNRAVVLTKVKLSDLFYVARPNENGRFRNMIDRKHVDFLLCDPGSMRPLLGIELDDSSHQRADRQDRDRFVDKVFARAGLALMHERVRQSYDAGDLALRIGQHVGDQPAHVQAPTAVAVAPACPKCGIPMVLRRASRGDRQGEQFWGCPNYPKCRETQAYSASA